MSDGWDHILDPDETILWQDSPDARFVFKPSMIYGGAFSLFFTGFSLFWMWNASKAGGVFWMFGLLFFGIGLYQLWSTFLGQTMRLKRTHYTLTTKRAFIAYAPQFGPRSLKSYPITAENTLNFDALDPATLIFAQEVHDTSTSDSKRTTIKEVGFHQIKDGHKVYRMFRDIQTQSKGDQL